MRTETIERKLYKFEELESKAQTRALDKLRESQCDDSYWYESTYEDAAEIFKRLGIISEKQVPLHNGKFRTDVGIWFSGFSCQGDGACFEGSYSYKAGSVKALKAYAPRDETLHAIAERLAAVQKKNGYGLTAKLTHRGNYYHENSVTIDVESSRGWLVRADCESEVSEALRDLMDWIYSSLQSEYDYQNSDEAVKDVIESNEYEFTADGRLA